VNKLLQKQESKKIKKDDDDKVRRSSRLGGVPPTTDWFDFLSFRHFWMARIGCCCCSVRKARPCCTCHPLPRERRCRCPRAFHGPHTTPPRRRCPGWPACTASTMMLAFILTNQTVVEVAACGRRYRSSPRLCSRPGCGQQRRYVHKRLGVPLCSLDCYRWASDSLSSKDASSTA